MKYPLASCPGPDSCEDLTVVACVATNHSLMLNVQKRDRTLGSVSVGTAGQRLMLRANGCLESLTAAEVSPILKGKLQKFSFGTIFKCCLSPTGTDSLFELSDME